MNSLTTVVGWIMIAASIVLMYAAFPGKYNTVLLPELLHIVGVPLALVFTAAQYAVAVRLKERRLVWLVTLLWITGALLGFFGRAIDIHGFAARHHVSYPAYILTAAACAAGLGLGIALVRGWPGEED